ncbi:MAG TPA: hypothetical protein VEX86_01895, partial [Longimicrobium sp.]|nr:hypothetical protein [Longimicrobium sp.]
LDTSGMHGIRVSTREVRVAGRVDRRADRAFAAMPVAAPPGYVPMPGQVEVHVFGAERTVARLSLRDVRAVVLLDSIPRDVPPAGVVVPVTILGVPAGSSARAVPNRVRIARAEDVRPPDGPAPAASPTPAPQRPARPR